MNDILFKESVLNKVLKNRFGRKWGHILSNINITEGYKDIVYDAMEQYHLDMLNADIEKYKTLQDKVKLILANKDEPTEQRIENVRPILKEMVTFIDEYLYKLTKN